MHMVNVRATTTKGACIKFAEHSLMHQPLSCHCTGHTVPGSWQSCGPTSAYMWGAPPRQRVAQLLQHERARALAQHEAAARRVEGARGRAGVIVVTGGQGAHPVQACTQNRTILSCACGALSDAVHLLTSYPPVYL